MKNQNNDKIVITGIGIVSPLANDAPSTWQALMAKKSGIDYIGSFDASAFPTQIAAEVKNLDSALKISDKKTLRNMARFGPYALLASQEALDDAGIHPTAATAERWGMVAGSGMMTAEFEYWARFQHSFAESGSVDVTKLGREIDAFYSSCDFIKAQSNSILGLLLKQHNILGYSMSVHTACASGGQALGLAMHAMRRGDADYMLVGGFDSMINPFGVSSFCLLGALSTDNHPPHQASRPFDLTRKGFVLGEGAAFLVLETLGKAKARGARIYAELAGEGNSLSSYRITDSHPSGDGAIQALANALKDADVTPDDVDYINAHGTSTKMNDFSETNAIKAVFGARAKQIPASSTKGQTGHLIAAAGAIEGAFSVLALHHGQIPMTANLTTPDPECDLDYVTEGPRKKEINVVVSNSFGFGGSNSCVVFKRVND